MTEQNSNHLSFNNSDHISRYFLYGFVSFVLFIIPFNAYGRQSSLSGGISVSQDYDSNIDRTPSNHISEWTTIVSPVMTFNSTGKNDLLSFSYAPGFRMNQRTDEHDIDHNLSISGDRAFSKNLSLSARDTFVRTDEPVQNEEAGIFITERRGKNRYWTNSFSVSGDYSYARNSYLTLGYNHSMLDSEAPLPDDYKRQTPNLSISHQFLPSLTGSLYYSYTKGEFDISDDLSEQTLHLSESYTINNQHALSLFYGYSNTNYETRTDDYTVLDGSAGWQFQIEKHSSLATSLGLSHVFRDNAENSDGVNYSFSYNKQLERTAFNLAGNGGFESLNFDGNSDGLSRFWGFRSSLQYQVTKTLSADIFISFRNDEFIERSPSEEEKTYQAGLNLSYSFARWYMITSGYTYQELDADIPSSEYEDHLFFIRLSFTKELWRS